MPEKNYNTLRANWKCALACILVSLCPFQYGLDFGLIQGIQAMIGFMKVFGYREPLSPTGWNIRTEVQQLIGSLMTLGAFLGSGFAGPIAWKLGRRHCIWLACVMCCGSNIIMMATTSVGALYFARLVLGLANGLFMTFSQLYLQESTPARFRGLALAAFQFWTSAGTLIGTIVDKYTAEIPGKASYQIPLGLIYIVPVLMSIGLIFIPESPRWLMERGKTEQARKALYWLRPDHSAVEGELTGIQTAIEEAKVSNLTPTQRLTR